MTRRVRRSGPGARSADTKIIMPLEDYARYDGLELAKLVKDKKVEHIELVDAAISRIEKHNPTLNAVIWRMFDRARGARPSRDWITLHATSLVAQVDALCEATGAAPTRPTSRRRSRS